MTVVKYLSVWETEYEGETYYTLTQGKPSDEGPYMLRVPADGEIKVTSATHEYVDTIELPERMGGVKQAGWLKTEPEAATSVFPLSQYADRMDKLDAIESGGTNWGESEPFNPSSEEEKCAS